jgi:hypothetical protein
MRRTVLSLISAASLVLACTPPPEAPATQYAAYSSDGRVSFHLADSAVQAAHATYCGNQTNCDAVENYNFSAFVETEYTLLVFTHKNLARPPGLTRSFLCSNAGENWTCHAPPIRPNR